MPHTNLLSQSGVKNSPRTRFHEKSEARQQRQQSGGFQPKKIFQHPMTKVRDAVSWFEDASLLRPTKHHDWSTGRQAAVLRQDLIAA